MRDAAEHGFSYVSACPETWLLKIYNSGSDLSVCGL